jgi:hypothetical protein
MGIALRTALGLLIAALVARTQWHLWHVLSPDFIQFASIAIGAVVWFLVMIFRDETLLLHSDKSIWRFSARAAVTWLAASAVGLVLVGVFVEALDVPTTLPALVAWARQFGAPATWVAFVTIAIALALVGVSLFLFRLHRRATYGLTESIMGIGLGLALASDPTKKIDSQQLWTGLLTASVYLFVRGLDNIHQGLVREPVDPWATWMKDQLASKTPSFHALVASIVEHRSRQKNRRVGR